MIETASCICLIGSLKLIDIGINAYMKKNNLRYTEKGRNFVQNAYFLIITFIAFFYFMLMLLEWAGNTLG